jgi:hypothetical protein
MGYGLRSLMALAAALSMGQSSAVVMTNPNAGNDTPALGNAINHRSTRGPARGGMSQPKRRKLAKANQGRRKGVKCMGRVSGSGRKHR